MSRTRIAFLLLALAPAALAQHAIGPNGAAPTPKPARDWTLPRDTTFGSLILRLSEPGGYFDTDNLISNESSYLHVMGALDRRGVRGGAYIGVGPGQNFSYIARIRPAIAFIIDIRRDNLLEHFLFKSLFTHARGRIEYLCLLTGREPPADVAAWNGRSVEDIVAYVDRAALSPARVDESLRRVAAMADALGYPLDAEDLATLSRFHRAFFERGLDLRFTSHGRAPRPYYPTLRKLILETDRDGNHASYLANEDAFRFVQSLEKRNLVIPVVGDLAGDHAFPAIGAEIRRRGLDVSALYTSNVEYYLMMDGTFDRFAANVSALPHGNAGVIIRSYFGRGYPHPQAVPGYYSTQLLQPIDSLLELLDSGEIRGYYDLVSKGLLPPA